MSAELKPCPFCGVALVANTNRADLYVKRYGTYYSHPRDLCYMSDAEVSPSQVEEWNARAAHTAEPPINAAAQPVAEVRITDAGWAQLWVCGVQVLGDYGESRLGALRELAEKINDGGRNVLSTIRDHLDVMLASATQHVDGDVVTGYTIKTGALHKILGVMAGAGYAVSIPVAVARAALSQERPNASVARQWQHDETGRMCELDHCPGPRWFEVPSNLTERAGEVPQAPTPSPSVPDGWCPICGGKDGEHKPGCEPAPGDIV
jgi:hypothetical protein